MSLYRIVGTKAWENLSASQTFYGDGWWNRQQRDGSLGTNSMVRRYESGVVRPGGTPRPVLTRGRRVFAIGSCFARRIESALIDTGVMCLSDSKQVKGGGYALFGVGWDFWNKYNTYSILNEVRWALEPASEFPETALVEVGEGCFWDYHLHLGRYRNLDKEIVRHSKGTLLEFHRSVTNLFQRIREAQVIIVALGLNEVWFDRATQLYLNDPPSRAVVERYPDRFVFEIPDVDANLQNLEALYTLVRTYGPTDAPIFVTISPVPLAATFSGEDVLVANALSKATLRYVARAWTSLHSDIIYFPAYEMVMNSARELVWEPDRIHVSDVFARQIAQHFLKLYSDPLENARDAILDSLRDCALPRTCGAPCASARVSA